MSYPNIADVDANELLLSVRAKINSSLATLRLVSGNATRVASAANMAEAEALSVPSVAKRIILRGFLEENDAPDFHMTRVDAEPVQTLGKLRTADRFLSDGTEDLVNGGWWQIAEERIYSTMVGVHDADTSVTRQNLNDFILLGSQLKREIVIDRELVISRQLPMSNVTDLKMTGIGDARIKMEALSTGSTGLIKFFDAERIHIESVEFNGDRFNQFVIHRFGIESGGGLVFVGGQYIEIRDCKFISTTDTGLRIRNASDCLVHWNEFRDNGDRQIYIGPGGSEPVNVKNIIVENNTCDWDGADPWTARGTARGGVANQIQLQAPFSFNADAAVNEIDNILFIANHGLWTNDRVIYRDGGGTTIGNLNDGQVYWVTKDTDNRIRLRETFNGDPIVLTKGVGTHTIEHAVEAGDAICLMSTYSVDFDASAVVGYVFNVPNHGFSQFDRFWYDANDNTPLPGMTPWVFDYSLTVDDFPVYFVDVIDDDHFRLLFSVEGPIVPAVAGSGTHKLRDFAFSSRIVANYDGATQTATITEASFGYQQSTPPTSDSIYLVRQRISDRIQLFLFGTDTLSVDFATYENARIAFNTLIQERKFGSINASCIATRPVDGLAIIGNKMEGGGNTLSTAHFTRNLTISNNVITTYAGAYAIELANDLSDATITGNVIFGNFLSNAAIGFNGGSSVVNVHGNIIKGFRRGIVTAGNLRYSGTAQSGTADTITLAANTSDRDGDTYIVGARLFIVAGTGAGQETSAYTFDATTQQAEVYPPFEIAPDATSEYQFVEMSTGVSCVGNQVTTLQECYQIQRSEDFEISGGSARSLTATAAINVTSSRDGKISDVKISGPSIVNGVVFNEPQTYINPSDVAITDLKLPDTVGNDTVLFDNTVNGVGAGITAKGCNRGPEIYDFRDYIVGWVKDNAPEGNREGGKGSWYLQTNGFAGDTLFIKTTQGGKTGWVHANAVLLKDSLAELQNIADAVNTTRKYEGMERFDTTLNRTVRAAGGGANAIWYPTGGSYSTEVVANASGGDGSIQVQPAAAYGCLYYVAVEVTENFDGDSSTTFRIGIGSNGDEYLADTVVTGLGQRVVSAPIPGNGSDNIFVSWTNNGSATSG